MLKGIYSTTYCFSEILLHQYCSLNIELWATRVGDLMFAVVNLCRHAKQDPETLLRQANQKFTKRFHGVETQVSDSGKDFSQHNIEQLEQYWQQVKIKEKK